MVVGWVGLVVNLLMVDGVLVLWMRGLKDGGAWSAVTREQRAFGDIFLVPSLKSGVKMTPYSRLVQFSPRKDR